jgi:penicillin-binding protein 1A
MPVKLTCPHCGKPTPLDEPLPLPGAEVMCESCGLGLSVTYPTGILEQLRQRGKAFQPDVPQDRGRGPGDPTARRATPKAPPPPAPSDRDSNRSDPDSKRDPGTSAATKIDATMVDTRSDRDGGPPTFGEIDRTVASARTPYGALAGNVDEAESARPLGVSLGADLPTEETEDQADDSTEDIDHKVEELDRKNANNGKKPKPDALKTEIRPKGAKVAKPRKKRSVAGCLAKIGMVAVMVTGLTAVVGAAAAGGGYWYFSRDLPSVESLQSYQPPTGTVVMDTNGKVLGEIFEERRYVIPLDKIPKHVQNAFIAAEDANFWQHGGVDYMGIARAVFVNTLEGKKAQGASTITQQVTRGLLLSNEKTVVRKAKEIILAWRIEDTYSKEHILYLYMNQIYLGSGAYGVEAASRVYFDKHVEDLDLAEAALLAGLPPAPSTYSPHRNFDTAKGRQKYVLDQMVKNGYATQAEADAAYAEKLAIVDRSNDFLNEAPHFTEYVRRYLVDKYGEERVLKEGLQVTTTCDLDLQKHAQDVLVDNVEKIDERMGFRRAGLVTLADDAAIQAKRDEEEAAMKKAWAKAQDPAGRVEEPPASVLEVGHRYEAVVLDTDHKWAKVAVGSHVGVVPVAWSSWIYEPNPRRSWKDRAAVDLEAPYDDDGDGKKDGPILRKGDVVQVRVESASTQDPDVDKKFDGTPGSDADLVAVRLWQDPEVESTMMSFDLHTGAVRAMVGGSDFAESQFNRAIQGYRQVGSTFKPIVYGSAIDSRKVTAATVVADAPLAFATDNDFIWKPSNYSNDYVGNLTLRQALALSKNTCTVRVLETSDPGMNDDVVYNFARKLGIGGPPTYLLPEDYVATPENDHLCPWVLEKPESTICMDRYPPKPDDMTNTAWRAQLKPGDEYHCRACDYSMALGSASLTMEELLRAYSAFGTGGKLVQPYYIEEIRDRDGNVLERHEAAEQPQVIDPGVATIVNWLLQGVVAEGTAHDAAVLGLTMGGKTGTTNDEKDAWFVGMTPNIITGVWVGYDKPQSLGISSTGGHTALPIWIDYMKVAAPKDQNKGPFPNVGDLEWAQIDEKTGNRVTSGGRSYPFLKGTAPVGTGVAAGQKTVTDLTTEM